ncbi:MAG: nitrous oxide reductase family maturation protein NosD [Haloferacaceae archaeon]
MTTVVLLLLASAAAVSGYGGSASTRTSGYEFDPPVPREYGFDASPADYPDGTARVDGTEYDTVAGALDAADPGDVVTLSGWFDATPTVNTSGVELRSAPDARAVVNGSAEGNVLTINAANVTVRGLWIRNSGYEPSDNDAAVWINGTNVAVVDNRLTEFTFGIWIDGTPRAYVANNTIVGRERIESLTLRGNGIQVWETEHTLITHNRITDVRDGIYYSFASDVTARYNVMWDMRYGVHYMYTDDSTLRRNLAFDNDVGWSLMVSENLRIVNNVAYNNTGRSGHGILVKSIDDSVIANNAVVANENGFYVYNSINDTIVDNLVLGNEVGINHQAGSVGTVSNNSFVRNDEDAYVLTGRQLAWNGSRRGNYWADAQVVDTDKDGVSEIRYRPAGLVQHLVQRHPTAAVFAHSPAFVAVRMAESSFPIIESPGVVDHHPLVRPPDDWTIWYRGGHDWTWYERWEPTRSGPRTNGSEARP